MLLHPAAGIVSCVGDYSLTTPDDLVHSLNKYFGKAKHLAGTPDEDSSSFSSQVKFEYLTPLKPFQTDIPQKLSVRCL